MNDKKMFGIEYTYRTGNSYGTHRETEILELTFDSADVAEANLRRIKEHYEQTLEVNSSKVRFGEKKKDDIFEANKNKDWFVLKEKTMVSEPSNPEYWSAIDDNQINRYLNKGYNVCKKIDQYYAEQCLNLYTDNGNIFQLSAPWNGYFEYLISAKVVFFGAEINFD